MAEQIAKPPTARVFLIEPLGEAFSLNGATRFGDIVYLFPCDESRSPIMDTVNHGAEMLEVLFRLRYSPDDDYIAFTGNVISLVTLAAAVGAVYGEFQVLLYDKINRDYYSRKLGNNGDIYP